MKICKRCGGENTNPISPFCGSAKKLEGCAYIYRLEAQVGIRARAKEKKAKAAARAKVLLTLVPRLMYDLVPDYAEETIKKVPRYK